VKQWHATCFNASVLAGGFVGAGAGGSGSSVGQAAVADQVRNAAGRFWRDNFGGVKLELPDLFESILQASLVQYISMVPTHH
jgi:hypothetical protein